MENAEYHARPEVSASQLKILKRSPLHFWDRFLNPDKPIVEPTPNMILGTLVHAAVLEPEQFDKRYIVVPEGIDKRTKEGKQLWQDLLATGREPVKFDVWQDVSNMTAAVIRDAAAKHILDISVKEKAERNMANTRVLELVAEHFKIPKNKVRIITGHHHPSKLMVIDCEI